MSRIATVLLMLWTASIQAQESNWVYPYQVLFTDSAYVNEKPLQQFEFVSRSDKVDVRGELVLVHYTGVVVELSDTDFSKVGIRKRNTNSSEYDRPSINPSEPILKQKRKEIIAEGANNIDLVLPKQNNDGPIQLKRNDSMFFSWRLPENIRDELLDGQESYIVYFKNIYDEILFRQITHRPFLNVPLSKIENDQDMLIVTIQLANYQDQIHSPAYGIKLVDKVDRSKDVMKLATIYYSTIIEALEADSEQDVDRADELYKKALMLSNNDPRFVKLYDSFIDRTRKPLGE